MDIEEKMDLILKKFSLLENGCMYLANYNVQRSVSYDIKDRVYDESFGMNIFDTIELLRILEEDRYMKSFPKEDQMLWEYRITMKGKLFIGNGGYSQQKINDSFEKHRILSLEKNQMSNDLRMFWVTVVLAIGTSIAALYYLHELLVK